MILMTLLEGTIPEVQRKVEKANSDTVLEMQIRQTLATWLLDLTQYGKNMVKEQSAGCTDSGSGWHFQRPAEGIT